MILKLISFCVAWGIIFSIYVALMVAGCWIAQKIEKGKERKKC